MKKKTLVKEVREVGTKTNYYFSLAPRSSFLAQEFQDAAEIVENTLRSQLCEGNRDFFMTCVTPVIDSYSHHPIVRDVLGGGKSISERIEPVLSKAGEVFNTYSAGGYSVQYFKPSEILDPNKSIVEELKGIIDFGQYYKRGCVTNPKTVGKVISCLVGSDLDVPKGVFRNMGISFGLGMLLGCKYLTSSTEPLLINIGFSMLGGFGGGFGSQVLALATMPIDHRTPNCVIANKSEKLLDDATFLDEALRDYQSIRKGK